MTLFEIIMMMIIIIVLVPIIMITKTISFRKYQTTETSNKNARITIKIM